MATLVVVMCDGGNCARSGLCIENIIMSKSSVVHQMKQNDVGRGSE